MRPPNELKKTWFALSQYFLSCSKFTSQCIQRQSLTVFSLQECGLDDEGLLILIVDPADRGVSRRDEDPPS